MPLRLHAHAVLLLCIVTACEGWRNWTDSSKLVVGTVLSLSSPFERGGEQLKIARGNRILRGYRFWEEHTNRGGGISLGQSSVPVELHFYDDEGDPAKAAGLFQSLVDDGVDVLLGGDCDSTLALSGVSKGNGMLGVTGRTGSIGSSETNPYLFYASVDVEISVLDVLTHIANTRSFKRIAIVSGQTLRHQVQHHAQSLGLQIVFQQTITEEQLGPAAHQTMNNTVTQLAKLFPEVLLGTSLSEEASVLLLRVAADRDVLRGWECTNTRVHPCVVESSFLKLIFLANAGSPSFSSAAQGYAHGVVTVQQWHPGRNSTDPHFGSAATLNQLWRSRADFGAGQDLDEDAALAIAAGAMLRMGLENASGFSHAAVRDALRMLDREMFLGRVRLDQKQRNVGHTAVTSQWSCGGEGGCVTLPVLPRSAYTSELTAPLGDCEKCAVGSVRAVEGWASSECVLCMDADREWIRRALAEDGRESRWIRESCQALAEPLLLGAVATRKADAMVAAMTLATQTAADGMSMLPNVRVELLASEEVQRAEEDADEWAHLEASRMIDAGAQALIVEAQAAHAVAGEEAARMAGRPSGLLVQIGGTVVSMQPNPSLQGVALAAIVAEVGWGRVQLVQCESSYCREMAAEFRREARLEGVEIARDVELVGSGTAQDVSKQLQLNDCVARILVLCIDTALAEVVVEHVRQSGRLEQFMLLGPETVSRVRRPLRGMLGLCLTAHPGAVVQAQSDAAWTSIKTALGADWTKQWALDHAEGVEAYDATLLIMSVMHSTLQQNATFARSASAVREAIASIDLYGLTGRMSFDNRLQRVGGRVGVVNWDGDAEEWKQVAVWDLESPKTLTKEDPSMSRLAWVQSLSWPESEQPEEVCRCEVWSRMPRGRVLGCAWSPTAVTVTVLCMLFLVCCVSFACRGVWRDHARDEEDRAVMDEIAHIRRALELSRKHGFLLSWERPTLLGRLGRVRYVPIERKQLEALAKMLLHMPFEITQLDAFYSWITEFSSDTLSNTFARSRSAASSSTDTRTLDAGFSSQLGVGQSNWRYKRLCKMVLQCATDLLNPADDIFEERREQGSTCPAADGNDETHGTSDQFLHNAPRTQDERFAYFQHHVAKLRMWDDQDGLLFRMLKDVVQDLMTELRDAFDARYMQMLEEDGGPELVELQWSPQQEWWIIGADLAEAGGSVHQTRDAATDSPVQAASLAGAATTSAQGSELGNRPAVLSRTHSCEDPSQAADACPPTNSPSQGGSRGCSATDPAQKGYHAGSYESLLHLLGMSDSDVGDSKTLETALSNLVSNTAQSHSDNQQDALVPALSNLVSNTEQSHSGNQQDVLLPDLSNVISNTEQSHSDNQQDLHAPQTSTVEAANPLPRTSSVSQSAAHSSPSSSELANQVSTGKGSPVTARERRRSSWFPTISMWSPLGSACRRSDESMTRSSSQRSGRERIARRVVAAKDALFSFRSSRGSRRSGRSGQSHSPTRQRFNSPVGRVSAPRRRQRRRSLEDIDILSYESDDLFEKEMNDAMGSAESQKRANRHDNRESEPPQLLLNDTDAARQGSFRYSAEKKAMQMGQDHPMIRAVRVNEDDQEEAMMEWERNSSNSSALRRLGSHGELVEEEVFILQLYRRATLLNNSFLDDVTRIVEAQKPVEWTNAAIGRMKSMAWLQSSPSLCQSPGQGGPSSQRNSANPRTGAGDGGEAAARGLLPRGASAAGDPDQTQGPVDVERIEVKVQEGFMEVELGSDQLAPKQRHLLGSRSRATLPRSLTETKLDRLHKTSSLLSRVSSSLWRLKHAVGTTDMSSRSGEAGVAHGRVPSSAASLETDAENEARRWPSRLRRSQRLDTAASKFSMELQRTAEDVERREQGALEGLEARRSRHTVDLGDDFSFLHGGLEAYNKSSQNELRLDDNEIRRAQSDDPRSSAAKRVTGSREAEELQLRLTPGDSREEKHTALQRMKSLLDISWKNGRIRSRASMQGSEHLRKMLKETPWTYQVVAAPCKNKARMREKVHEYSKRQCLRPFAANILDPVRATVVCDGPRSILQAVQWFMKDASSDSGLPSLPAIRMKNKFGMEDASEFDGYRDLLICVIHTGQRGLRIIGEIQFHDAQLHALKRKMHKLYKVKRAEQSSVI